MVLFTATFALALFAFVVGASTPGPATLLIAATAMERGRPAALATVAGIVCGSYFWGIMAASGFAVAMQTYGWVAELLRVVGALYLLFLAFKAFRACAIAAPMPDVDTAEGRTLLAFYRGGLLLHLTNPKAIFVWVSVIAIAAPGALSGWQLFIIVAVLEAVAVTIFTSYAFLFATVPARNTYRRIKRWVDGASGLVFAGFGLGLILRRA